ncbi:hypothetical protein FIBSPDRAFT_877201, partial [Athelia psychrophila]
MWSIAWRPSCWGQERSRWEGCAGGVLLPQGKRTKPQCGMGSLEAMEEGKPSSSQSTTRSRNQARTIVLQLCDISEASAVEIAHGVSGNVLDRCNVKSFVPIST